MTRFDEASYDRRLAAVRAVAARFPGRAHERLGLWAGIFLQTKWQKDSGRETLPIWNRVNASLTIAPLVYGRAFSREASPGREDTAAARAWKAYFRHQDEARTLLRSKRARDRLRGAWRTWAVVPRKFWRAHNTAVAEAVRAHVEEFQASPLPREELAFWGGWIRFLVFCETLSPPTTDAVLRRLLAAAMPPSAPLGGGNRIRNQPLFRRVFLNAIAAIGKPL